MKDDIRAKKLLYHLTSLNNIRSILENGLLPRSSLNNFVDVADPEIIEDRKRLRLERHVPFHFFAKNPFDGRVQRDDPRRRFVLIAVQREVARAKGWKIIPKHPLAGGQIELHDYDAGMETIDWDVMNRRDYSDQHCKCVCMAECLAPGPVPPDLFHSIYVKDDEAQAQVLAMLDGQDRVPHVNVAPAMFSK
ncbi:DarT ssDNA thymidine ADP-ribosyltransferase family protein [Roseateles sp.]|uniref:DarT ssDNA thymidine ADP-ribosyltransferase family protein n=1 Tax=Roseateles sp. TaxID=1971397 RepID=UPI003D0E315F